MSGDGYPHPMQVQKIKTWPLEDGAQVFRYIQNLYRWPHLMTFTQRRVSLSTGGWSGHEEMVDALKRNHHFIWPISWISSTRGGHYVFDLTRLRGLRGV
jgi:hypothetical protein